jgi:hypothetical protein
MTTRDLAHTPVANQMQVVAGLTTDLRRTISADAQALVELENAVVRVVRALKRLQPKTSEDV